MISLFEEYRVDCLVWCSPFCFSKKEKGIPSPPPHLQATQKNHRKKKASLGKRGKTRITANEFQMGIRVCSVSPTLPCLLFFIVSSTGLVPPYKVSLSSGTSLSLLFRAQSRSHSNSLSFVSRSASYAGDDDSVFRIARVSGRDRSLFWRDVCRKKKRVKSKVGSRTRKEKKKKSRGCLVRCMSSPKSREKIQRRSVLDCP